MGQALFSGSLQVSAAIAASATSDATLYTVPSGSYALFNLNIAPSSATLNVTVGGKSVFSAAGSSTVVTYPGIVAGPGQAVAFTSSGGTQTVSISGVLLANG